MLNGLTHLSRVNRVLTPRATARGPHHPVTVNQRLSATNESVASGIRGGGGRDQLLGPLVSGYESDQVRLLAKSPLVANDLQDTIFLGHLP
jgi:hypothetical protein